MSNRIKDVSDGSFEQDVLGAAEPVLVDFWVPWCGPCIAMTPVVEALAEDFQGRASVVKINVDDNPASAARYGVRGIPTLILFKDGKEVDRVIGATTKETLARMLEERASVTPA